MNHGSRTLLALFLVVVTAACGSPDSPGAASQDDMSEATPSPTPVAIRVDAVPKAALSLEDLGSGWSKFDLEAVEGCTKIGGKICVSNVPGRVSTKTQVAYNQSGAQAGYVANAVLLMAVDEDAREVVAAFRDAARTKQWSQTFSAGDATYKLSDLKFENQGDETFAVHITSTAKERRTGAESSREIDYIIFRSGRVLSFLYVIKADSAALAKKSAAKIRVLVSGQA